jgi:signal transduction histidine kinase
MSTGGELIVESKLSNNKEFIEVRFKDNGQGIPDHFKDRIFDPFFTTKENGTGLGLSISYGIIERHGGTITFESKARVGTTFIINLPIHETEEDDERD